MLRSLLSMSVAGLLPLALFAAACNDDEDNVSPKASAGTKSGAGGSGASGGAGSSGGGAPEGGSTSNGGEASAGGGGVPGGSGLGGASGSGLGGTGGSGLGGESGSGLGGTSFGGEGGSGFGGEGGGSGGEASASLGPDPVDLGTAANYAIVAKSAITNVPTSLITGHLGISPAAATYITGFPLTNAGTYWTSPQVVGRIFAANNDSPTPIELTTAVADMETAYTNAAGRSSPDFLNLQAGTIGGLTLAPGLYRWTSAVTIPTDITLAGDANDVWIFQVTGDLTLSSAKQMTLSGGAASKNIFWQVAGMVNLGTTSHAEGIMLSQTAVTLQTGASINGRLLAQTAVALAGATVTQP